MGSVQSARRHRTGLGLFCLAEGRNCRSARKSQTTKARSTGEILALPNRRNTYTVPLVRGRAVDKLGMMRCVVCQVLSCSGTFRTRPSVRQSATSGGSPQQRRDRPRRCCRASRLELHSCAHSRQPNPTFTRHVSCLDTCVYHVTAKTCPYMHLRMTPSGVCSAQERLRAVSLLRPAACRDRSCFLSLKIDMIKV
jgi:hypothetical protein